MDSGNSRGGFGAWFVRAARGVGDLGNPFYREERQRDVWNEASAVGLQVVLWLGLLASTVLVWVIGAPAVPYAIAFLAIIGVASLVTVGYARCLGVDVESSQRVLRLRLVPYVVVLALLAVGIARTTAVSTSFGVGLAVGAAGALVIATVALVRGRRRARAA